MLRRRRFITEFSPRVLCKSELVAAVSAATDGQLAILPAARSLRNRPRSSGGASARAAWSAA
jgi:hypothetical protein